MGPRISVIIPTYQSGWALSKCLTSLRMQSTSVSFEVIVVDSSEDQGVTEVVIRFPEVRFIRLSTRAYPGEARNVGLRFARGEVVAFVDSALILDADWIEIVANSFKDPTIKAIAGARKIMRGTTIPGRIQFLLEFYDFLHHPDSRIRRFVPAGNSAFRKECLGSNPFVTDLRTVEDRVFCHLFFKTEIMLVPALTVTYLPAKGWKQCYQHVQSLGFWAGIARCRYPLPGSFLSKVPALAILLWPYRLIRLFQQLLTFRRSWSYCQDLLLIPVFIIGVGVWTFSFIHGIRREIQTTTRKNLSETIFHRT